MKPEITNEPCTWRGAVAKAVVEKYTKRLAGEVQTEEPQTVPTSTPEKWHSRLRGSLRAYGRPLAVSDECTRAPGRVEVVWRGDPADPTLQAGEVPFVSETFYAGTPTATAPARVERFIEDYFREGSKP